MVMPTMNYGKRPRLGSDGRETSSSKHMKNIIAFDVLTHHLGGSSARQNSLVLL
jgi:hypothetical protein